MNEMEPQEKIRRLIEFMNIPEFDLIISAKLLELEISLRPQIKHFEELKSRFKKMARNEMRLLETENIAAAPGKPVHPAYYFELKRIKDRQPFPRSKWTVWDIHPEPPDRVPQMVLNQLIQSMNTYPSDSTRIEHREILSPASGGYFDTSFTRYSDIYAFGVLRPSSKSVETPVRGEAGGMIKLNMAYRDCTKEDSYEELLSYLETYPETRERLLAYFYMMEKPRVDKSKKSA